MNVTCPHCSTKLNLPDDKLPKHKDSVFKCPKCKGTVTVKAVTELPGQPGPGPIGESENSNGKGGGGGDLPVPGGSPHVSRRSSSTKALVCMAPSESRDLLEASIRRLDFSMDFPKNAVEALDLLEYQSYPLMVLDDTFDSDGTIHRKMNDMDMILRRRICLVRICQGVASGNAMAAFHGSANFILGEKDIELEDDLYIEDLLHTALDEHDRFYAVFTESMKVVGKA